MTPNQAIEKLNQICIDCGKYASEQRSTCASCKVELARTETVLEEHRKQNGFYFLKR